MQTSELTEEEVKRNFWKEELGLEKLSEEALWRVVSVLEEELNKRNNKLVQEPGIIITMEGGLIQDVITNAPMKIFVIDYDIEGADANEITDGRAVCSYRTPTPGSELDPEVTELVRIFMKEVFQYELKK